MLQNLVKEGLTKKNTQLFVERIEFADVREILALMEAILNKGLNCEKQLEVWKAAAKKVLQEWKNMSPEEAVDCLKCINRSGY